jgi:hypothetical protein
MQIRHKRIGTCPKQFQHNISRMMVHRQMQRRASINQCTINKWRITR